MRLVPSLHLSIVLGFLGCLAPIMVMAQAKPSAKEQIRREQVQEIEKYQHTIDGEDRSVNYVTYVVLGALGIIGCMVVVRRLLLY